MKEYVCDVVYNCELVQTVVVSANDFDEAVQKIHDGKEDDVISEEKGIDSIDDIILLDEGDADD